jgi:hypothetical protein
MQDLYREFIERPDTQLILAELERRGFNLRGVTAYETAQNIARDPISSTGSATSRSGRRPASA